MWTASKGVLLWFVTLTYATGSAAQPQADKFSARVDLRIDGYVEDLVPIHWLGIAQDGRIVITQRQDHKLRFFDASGNLLGSFGREGKGPAEFPYVQEAGWVDNSVWVSDGSKRNTIVSLDRKLVQVADLPMIKANPSLSRQVPRLFAHAIPRAIYKDRTMLVVAQPAAPQPNADPEIWLLRIAPDGIVQKIVARVLTSQKGRVQVKSSRTVASYRVPFYPEPVYKVASDGSAIAIVTPRVSEKSDNFFRVTLISADGDTTFSREYAYKPVPIPKQAFDSAVRVMVAKGAAYGVRPEPHVLNQLRQRVPGDLPPVVSLFVSSDGRVWLALQSKKSPRTWLILGPKGEQIGSVAVPANITLLEARGFTAWGIERDEYDVDSIVRLRLSPMK
jgi:hypothetical protein